MTVVDTNVLLDVATSDPHWAVWSQEQLDRAEFKGDLVINGVIYAEFSVGYARLEEVDEVLDAIAVELSDIPRSALFLAGKAYRRYRASGGTRLGVLPDFFIGAHAAAIGAELLTRDPARYRSYFPTLRLITPALQ